MSCCLQPFRWIVRRVKKPGGATGADVLRTGYPEPQPSQPNQPNQPYQLNQPDQPDQPDQPNINHDVNTVSALPTTTATPPSCHSVPSNRTLSPDSIPSVAGSLDIYSSDYDQSLDHDQSLNEEIFSASHGDSRQHPPLRRNVTESIYSLPIRGPDNSCSDATESQAHSELIPQDRPKQDPQRPPWQSTLPPNYGGHFVPVLTTLESELPVGNLSPIELHSKIVNLWPPKLISRLKLPKQERLPDAYIAWLNYFITANHIFGLVHGWVSVLINDPKIFLGSGSGLRPALPPSAFDANCEVIGSVRGQPKLMSDKGRISLMGHFHCARRAWDLRANTVIPYCWLPVDAFAMLPEGRYKLVPVSHAWVADEEMEYVWTNVNRKQWPVPLPRGTSIEAIRADLLQHGVHYTWLDVVCLRQAIPQTQRVASGMDDDTWQGIEATRLDEWKVDVPLIGAVYGQSDFVVVFLSGLGRAFLPEGWGQTRHWLQRAWTLQETKSTRRTILAGVDGLKGTLNPWECHIDSSGTTLAMAVENIYRPKSKVNILWELQRRNSTNPRDKIAGAFFALFSSQYLAYAEPIYQFWVPTYHPSDTLDTAWARVVAAAACTFKGLNAFTIDLLRIFPYPSSEHWFPSWTQLLRYPDWSHKEEQLPDDVVPKEDLSLKIQTEHVFLGVQLKRERGPCITSGEDVFGDYYLATGTNVTGQTVEVRLVSPPMMHDPQEPRPLPEVEILPGTDYVLVDITESKNCEYAHHGWDQHAHLMLVCKQLSPMVVEEPSGPMEAEEHGSIVSDAEEWSSYGGETGFPVVVCKLRRVTTVCWWHDAFAKLPPHEQKTHNESNAVTGFPFPVAEPDIGKIGDYDQLDLVVRIQ